MTAMRKRAWKAGREMIWPVVARRYMESFERARAESQRAVHRDRRGARARERRTTRCRR